MITQPYYPEVEVRLTGRSSNSGAIMGAVTEALREHGVPRIEIDLFREECFSGDYNYLLQTCMAWVVVT